MMSGRITIPEIALRLSIGRLAVYSMLEQGIIPGIRLGRRWIVTRHAYEQRYLEAMCLVWVVYGARTNTWNHAFKLLRR